MSLPEKYYGKYLCRSYRLKTGKRLRLKKPKTFSEKIQWLKIYDNLPIKTQLTDKVLVRDYVKDKIGEKFLKPVIQVCSSFDEINFESLPDSFVVKCNHGCKWHFIIKDKKSYLEDAVLFDYTRSNIYEWMRQSFFGWSDFETQYRNIQPAILIEPLLREKVDEPCEEIEVYCFNSIPRVFQRKKHVGTSCHISTFDENYCSLDLKFHPKHVVIKDDTADEYIREAVELSKELAKDFKLVRVDWQIYKNHLYFEEMTFTPYSGFFVFSGGYEDWDIKLGKILNLKGG